MVPSIHDGRWTTSHCQALTVVLPKELQTNARRTQARGVDCIFLYPHVAHGRYTGVYIVALLDTLLRGQLRALASLDVRMPPGPARFPLQEMLQTARAVQFSKHKMNNLFMNEKLYHDVMFSLGTGAAEKLDVDITSEFALLPGSLNVKSSLMPRSMLINP